MPASGPQRQLIPKSAACQQGSSRESLFRFPRGADACLTAFPASCRGGTSPLLDLFARLRDAYFITLSGYLTSLKKIPILEVQMTYH